MPPTYHGGYTTLPICLSTTLSRVHPVYTPSCTLLGTLQHRRWRAGRHAPGLNTGITLGWELLGDLKSSKVWRMEEASAHCYSAPHGRKSERLDRRRVFSHIFPMVRVCCAEWVHPCQLSDRWGMCAERQPGHHPFHCWLMFLTSMGPGAGVSHLSDRCCEKGSGCEDCYSAHKPEMRYSRGFRSRKDTGGERQISNPKWKQV